MPRTRILFSIASVVVLIAAVAAISFVVADIKGAHIVQRAHDKIERYLSARSDVDSNEHFVEWEERSASLVSLEILDIPLIINGIHDYFYKGGAIAEIQPDLLAFSDASGAIGTVDLASGEIKHGIAQVPINFAGLSESSFAGLPNFNLDRISIQDFMVADGGRRLYVSHHRFENECFRLAISSIEVSRLIDDGRVASGDPWEEIFRSDFCIGASPVTDRDLPGNQAFSGHQSGGRMVPWNDESILLSVGDFEFDGQTRQHSLPQDPSSQVGKILKIDVATGAADVVAKGLRNPQGLYRDSGGTVWETEHGPMGGDELNVIEQGANYGWPEVTLGTAYGAWPRPWNANEHQGAHNG